MFSIFLNSGSFNCIASVPYISLDLTTASSAIILYDVGQLLLLQKICSFWSVILALMILFEISLFV